MIFIDFGLLHRPYCKISYLLAEKRYPVSDTDYVESVNDLDKIYQTLIN